MTLEVESIIESQVRAIIEEKESSSHHRITVVSRLVDALESDAAWVEMYGITGELNVPELRKKEELSEEVAELLKEARKVSSHVRAFSSKLSPFVQRLADHRHPESPVGFWREIKIPVDVPFMNVGLVHSAVLPQILMRSRLSPQLPSA